MLLQPSKQVLIAIELIKHSELDVRVSVASCISQIIRITAPDEPYEEDQMKEFSLLGNSTFEILSCMSGRAYSKAFKSLEMYATVGHMFHLFLDGIRGKTSVSEGLNEDIMKLPPQCRPLHSKDEAPCGSVSKQNPQESLSHLRKSLNFEMENSTTAPTTQTSDSEVVLKRKSDDVGWNFCILSDAKNMDKVQCIKCGKKMSGGVYRIKEHIAQIKGNVASCTKASKEDQELCRNAINEAKLKKKMKKCEGEELRSQVNVNKEIDFEQLEESLGFFKPQHSLGPMDKFASAIAPEISLSSGNSNLRVQNINNALFKERSEIVKDYVARWVYEGGISFNSIELDSFKMMMEAVGQFGPSFVPPTRYELSGPLLKKNIERTKDLLKSHEEEWKLHGCSIMTDAWSDRKRRSIMNLCVNSRLGTVFLSSKEFFDVAHTSQVIFEYVDQCIEEVGAENVLQIVTDNASNNMGAAKLLKEKRPKILWTSCAAHTIDLMLESIAKQPRFKKVIDQAKALTVFLYAHHKVLAMMRSYTKMRDIVRPGVTRFASAFLTLQSIHEKRGELKAMFGSNEWEACKFSKCVKGKDAYTNVMSMGFWNGVASCTFD